MCVCVRIFLVLKKPPTNISIELQQLLSVEDSNRQNALETDNYRQEIVFATDVETVQLRKLQITAKLLTLRTTLGLMNQSN